MEQHRKNLIIPAVIAVLIFGILSIFQVFNIPLSIPAIAGLVILLTDRRYLIGLASVIGCLTVSLLIGGQLLALETALLVVVPAVILTICIRLNKRPVFSVFITMLPALILVLLFVINYGDSSAYYDEIAPELGRNFDEMSDVLGMSNNLGISDVEYDRIKESYLNTIRTIVRFMPALVLTSATIMITLAYLLVGYCFKREDRYMLAFPRLRGWKIDERVMVFLGIGMLMVILGNGVIANIGENIALYFVALFSFGGISLMEYYMQKRKFNRMLRFAIYFSLVIFNYYAAAVMGILGLIDSHFDFRRLRAVKIG